MNTYAAASIPIIALAPRSTDINDVLQGFIQDPPAGNLPPFLPNIEPLINGSDITNLGPPSADVFQALASEAEGPIVSTMVYEALRQAGMIN